MIRKIVWTSVVFLVLAVLGGVWFLTYYEQKEITRYEEASVEARRNPWLAMERFLVAMGKEVSVAHNAQALDSLPEKGVLILDKMRAAYLNKARAESLLEWVKKGGYLIVVTETPNRPDPILDFFDVQNRYQKEKKVNLFNTKEGDSADSDNEEVILDEELIEELRSDEEDYELNASNSGRTRSDRKSIPTCMAPAPDTLEIKLPGDNRDFHIAPIYGYLSKGKYEPLWLAGTRGDSEALMHFSHGAGNVTMISSFDRLFGNWQIGKFDHADFLWALLTHYQKDPKQNITLLSQVPLPSLWHWLVESAWMALIAAITLLLFWLWSVVPRFGVIETPSLPIRRELGEHLAAIGRYVWRSGNLHDWLDIARESFKNTLAIRHPDLILIDPKLQVTKLSDRTGISTSLIAQAMYGKAITIQSFTQAIRTLRDLEQTL